MVVTSDQQRPKETTEPITSHTHHLAHLLFAARLGLLQRSCEASDGIALLLARLAKNGVLRKLRALEAFNVDVLQLRASGNLRGRRVH